MPLARYKPPKLRSMCELSILTALLCRVSYLQELMIFLVAIVALVDRS